MNNAKNQDRIEAAARYLLDHCGSLATGESVILVIDDTTRELAPLFCEAATALGARHEVVETTVTDRHGKEPADEVACRMDGADLVVGLTKMSLAHTQARRKLCERGGRYLSLPGYSMDLLMDPAVVVDFRSHFSLARAISDAFSNGSEVCVKTRAGTNMRLLIDGREGNCCPGFVDSEYRLGSPPDIEANVSPVEQASEGVAVVDGSVACDEIGLLTEPIILEVRGGNIVNTRCGRSDYVRMINALFDRVGNPRARILGECGVGLNPMAKLTGNMLTDEGALGCVHFGFGSNSTVGGKNKVPFHVDFIMRNASLWIDEKQIFRDGAPVLETKGGNYRDRHDPKL